MRARRLAGLGAATTLLTACSLLLGDGYVGGSSDASDASAEGGPSTTSVDAATPDGEGVASSWSLPCERIQPTPIFCEDFDRPPLRTVWSNRRTAGGRVEDADGGSTTPPLSLRAVVDTPHDAARYAIVAKRLEQLPTRVSLSYDVMLLEPAHADLLINRFEFGSLTLAIQPGRNRLWQRLNGKFPPAFPVPPLPLNRWVHVVLSIDGSQTPATFTARFDDEVVAFEREILEPISFDGEGVLSVGVDSVPSDAEPFGVLIDSVVVTSP